MYVAAATVSGTSLDLSTTNYLDTTRWQELTPSTQDVVKVGETYYRFLAASAAVTLSTEDFTNTGRWQKVQVRNSLGSLVNPLQPGLSATSTTGDIVITGLSAVVANRDFVFAESDSGDLFINQISAGGAVTLVAGGAIKVARHNNEITTWEPGSIAGFRLNLTAQGGGIGNATDRPLINSVMLPAALAGGSGCGAVRGDVFVKENGDLLLNQLITRKRGSHSKRILVDANTVRCATARYSNSRTASGALRNTDSTGAQEIRNGEAPSALSRSNTRPS